MVSTSAAPVRVRSAPKPTCAPHLAAPVVKNRARSEDVEDTSIVQLRGLPFRASIADIKVFLGKHVEDLATDGEPAIRLLLNNQERRPSGFARVRFKSADAAGACCVSLHRQEMDSRYIEVLPWNSSMGKSRRKRKLVMDDDMEFGTAALDDEFANEQIVLQDIRKFLSQQSGQAPLDSIHQALSPSAKTYLRSSGYGRTLARCMKHFLPRFPEEFRLEDENVIWLPIESGASESYDEDDKPPGNFSELSVEEADTAISRPSGLNKNSHAHLDVETHPNANRSLPMVRLRGLPFSTTAQEVLNFFTKHGVESLITNGIYGVQMLTNANGRSSGQAAVQMHRRDDADHVRQILNKQFVGDRYVEVFAYGDEGAAAEKRQRFM